MSSRPTSRPDSGDPKPADRTRPRDFEQWESELPAASRIRAGGPIPKWFRGRVCGPVVKWLHQAGRSALAPERFL